MECQCKGQKESEQEGYIKNLANVSVETLCDKGNRDLIEVTTP